MTLLGIGTGKTHAQCRSWYTSLVLCYHAPFAQLGEGHLPQDVVGHRPICPCRSDLLATAHTTWAEGKRKKKKGGVSTFFSVRFFFFKLSSPPAARLAFIPFSSPGTGPDSRRAANNAGLGFLNVYFLWLVFFPLQSLPNLPREGIYVQEHAWTHIAAAQSSSRAWRYGPCPPR